MDLLQNTPSNALPPIGTADTNVNSVPGQVNLASAPPKDSKPATKNLAGASAPPVADDVDLIEKEWVNQIKDIVNRTAGDPYEKASQLAAVRSDYLQKRYNKTIKPE